MKQATGRSRELFACIGATGSGKSTIGRLLVQTRGPVDRVLVLDRLGARSTSFSAGFSERVFSNANDLMRELRARLDAGKPFRFTLAPPTGTEAKAAGWLCRVAKWAADAFGVELWVIFEEAQNACKHGELEKDTIECAQDGRHFGVSLGALAQSPVGIGRDVRRELFAGELLLGRLVEDEETLRRRLKKHMDRLALLRTIKDETAAGRPPISDWLWLAEGRPDPEHWTLRFRGGRPELRLAVTEEAA